LRSNCYALMSPSCSQDQFLNIRAIAIYHLASMPNHDCMPNATRWDDTDWKCEGEPIDDADDAGVVSQCRLEHSDLDTTLAMRHYAVTDIAPGEEVTISYCYAFEDVNERQDTTIDHYGFKCACFRCATETTALKLQAQRKNARKSKKGQGKDKERETEDNHDKEDNSENHIALSEAEAQKQSSDVHRIREYVGLYVCNPPDRLFPFDDLENDQQITRQKRDRKAAKTKAALAKAKRNELHKGSTEEDNDDRPATDEVAKESEEVNDDEEEKEDERPLCNGTLIRRDPRGQTAPRSKKKRDKRRRRAAGGNVSKLVTKSDDIADDMAEMTCNACLRVLNRPRQKLDRADLLQ